MTKAEELDWIYRLRSNIYVYMPKEWLIPMNNALGAAIKALEKEPCEDVISRAEAEAIFRNARSKLNPSDYKTADEFNTRDLMLLNAEQLIHLLPSVTPARKKGYWIDHSEEGFVECSECGSCTNCDDNIADLHFCFSCGAKMIEPQESEE